MATMPAPILVALDAAPKTGARPTPMLAKAIRTVAVLASAIVVVSFVAFAIDQLDHASRTQQGEVTGQPPPDPTPTQERARERDHSRVREAIDDADDVLLTPFARIADRRGAWVAHGVPAALALLVYGLGLGYLARAVESRR